MGEFVTQNYRLSAYQLFWLEELMTTKSNNGPFEANWTPGLELHLIKS